MGHDDEDATRRPAATIRHRIADRFSPRSSRSASTARERLPDEQRVAVLRPAGPAPGRLVAARAGRPDQPVLLEDVDDLLEPEEVGLERGHVGEDQRQPLVPAIGEVADVEGRDVEAVHPSVCTAPSPFDAARGDPSAGRSDGRIGRRRPAVNVNVEPRPSSDSTQIRPPCCSITWRAIASPRPVPPPRTRTRSTL